MSSITIRSVKTIEGVIEVPGDKSISQRAVMLSSIARGVTEVRNFLMGEDCISTINAFREMGVEIKSDIKNEKSKIIIEGKGLRGLKRPNKELYLGNSGTTMRILTGILAGQKFECVLTGDESLSKRPMRRIAAPLAVMGADIRMKDEGRRTSVRRSLGEGGMDEEIYPPLVIKGKYPLKAIKYKMPVASAQVKSAVLLAGLYADGVTEIEEPLKSRDHTERMLTELGADIKIEGLRVSIKKSVLRSKGEIFVPGDISSAAFFIVAALILKTSKVTIKNVGVNPTRTGVIDILKKMGGKIEVFNIKDEGSEPLGDISAYSSELKGINIEGDIIPKAIDEMPIIMVAAAFAKGITVIKGAGELRIKETDRITSMVTNLKRFGADIKVEGDAIVISGMDVLKADEVDSFGDHRTVMAMLIAGLRAEGKTTVLNTGCINKSFPGFKSLLSRI